MKILKPLIVTAIVGISSWAQAAETCYRSLNIESNKTFVLITNNALIGGEAINADCLDLFMANTSGITLFNQKVPLVLQLEQDSIQMAESVKRIVGLTLDIKIEIATGNGSGTLKAFSR